MMDISFSEVVDVVIISMLLGAILYLFAREIGTRKALSSLGYVKVSGSDFEKWMRSYGHDNIDALCFMGVSKNFHINKQDNVGLFVRTVPYGRTGKHQSVVVMDTGLSLPDFIIRPKRFRDNAFGSGKSGKVLVGDPDFKKSMHFEGYNQDAISRVFTNTTLLFFRRNRDIWVECKRGMIFVFKEFRVAETYAEIVNILAESSELVSVLRKSHEGYNGPDSNLRLAASIVSQEKKEIVRYRSEIDIRPRTASLKVYRDGLRYIDPTFETGFPYS